MDNNVMMENVMSEREIFEDRARMYVDVNNFTYMDKFRKMKNKNTKVSWNWAAFIFGYNWLLYRKMYVEMIVMAGVWFLLDFIVNYFNTLAYLSGNRIFLLVALGISIGKFIYKILLGIFSNFYYMRRIEKFIEKEKTMTSEEARNQEIDKGGVNKKALIIWIVVYSVLWLLL